MRGPLKKSAVPTNEERRALILKWAASSGTRFVRSKRRALVAAVNDGLFSLQEVQAMFRLSIDEYLEWVTEP